jgi:hypothetical protein
MLEQKTKKQEFTRSNAALEIVITKILVKENDRSLLDSKNINQILTTTILHYLQLQTI